MSEPIQRTILTADTYMGNEACQMNLLNRYKTGFYSRGRKSVVPPLEKMYLHTYGKALFAFLSIIYNLQSCVIVQRQNADNPKNVLDRTPYYLLISKVFTIFS